jgi:glycogen debranching enzyme
MDPALKQIKRLCKRSKSYMDELKVQVNIGGIRLQLYNAGKKGGEVRFGLFARDLFITSFMLQDAKLLKETIKFALLTQGKKRDPITGEEPYRVIHEFDEVEIRGLKTRYNAAETAQLLLIGLDLYYKMTEDREFLRSQGENISNTIGYILSHLKDGIFWEDPIFCGCRARHYALKATYWKDSGLPGREDPYYPVAYTLVQAQTASALRGAAELAESFDLGYSPKELEKVAKKVAEGIFTKLWDNDLNYPLIAKDQKGLICGISSDGLHMLAYLRKEDISQAKLERICKAAQALETPYGYRTYAPRQLGYAPNSYHLGSIWPFEQFFIAKGALIHGREEILEKSLKIIKALEKFGFPELFYWDNQSGYGLRPSNKDSPKGTNFGGCDLQLWSAAYPQGISSLLNIGGRYG